MAVYVLKNCKLYAEGYNLSGDMNQMELLSERDAVDNTVFGDDTEHSIPGLFRHTLNHQGFYQADNADFQVDDVLNSMFATADQIVSICPTDGAAGERVFTIKSLEVNYSPGGRVGEAFAFTVSAKGVSDLVRATVMETGAKTAIGTGTARQLGAVTANQKLYATMHVVAVSGTNPTLDMIIQSDDAEGFASAEDRITFSQATAIGAQWATPVEGAITDDWWRCSYTIGGTDDPSFTVVVLVGIQ